MAFDGDLESLPITDIIQLLHSTGKSGTLTLRGPKGESQLVFDGGYIVSANHVNNSMRIGRILVDMGALSRAELEKALSEQSAAGRERAPLLATLLEAGAIQPSQAYKGLEILIELTIVEILTWSTGTFSLDVAKTFVSDEYRYFPEKLKQQIQLNTQCVLMDALRIYDERKRDGTLMDAEFFGADEGEGGEDPEGAGLSAEDLGLDALDALEDQVPEHFSAINEQKPGSLRHRLVEALPGIAPGALEELAGYLEGVERPALARPLFLYSGDALTRELTAAVGGPPRFAAKSEAELLLAVEGTGTGGEGVLLLTADAEKLHKLLPLLGTLRQRHPGLETLLLLRGVDHSSLASALKAQVGGVVPWPRREGDRVSLVADAVAACEALRLLLARLGGEKKELPPLFLQSYREMSGLSAPPEITLLLLRFVSSYFRRGITLIRLRGELVAEKGIGFGGSQAVSSVRLRTPIDTPSLLSEVARHGEMLYREADPETLKAMAELGPPQSPEVLLLPITSMGRVIAVIYGDWGSGPAGKAPLSLLELMARHAGLVLDNALFRKRAAQGTLG